MGQKQKGIRKLKFEFILSIKILTFLPLPLTNTAQTLLKMAKLGVGGRFTRNTQLPQEQHLKKTSFASVENHKGILSKIAGTLLTNCLLLSVLPLVYACMPQNTLVKFHTAVLNYRSLPFKQTLLWNCSLKNNINHSYNQSNTDEPWGFFSLNSYFINERMKE